MKTFFFVFVSALASFAHASVCDEVQRRIGPQAVFENFIPNSADHPLVLLKQTRANSHEYLSVAGDRSGAFTLKSYGPLCILKSQDQNAYFAADKSFGLSVPNARGECWVYMARISQLVPADREAEFIKGGFCVSAVSYDPETMWLATSAMTPAQPSSK